MKFSTLRLLVRTRRRLHFPAYLSLNVDSLKHSPSSTYLFRKMSSLPVAVPFSSVLLWDTAKFRSLYSTCLFYEHNISTSPMWLNRYYFRTNTVANWNLSAHGLCAICSLFDRYQLIACLTERNYNDFSTWTFGRPFFPQDSVARPAMKLDRSLFSFALTITCHFSAAIPLSCCCYHLVLLGVEPDCLHLARPGNQSTLIRLLEDTDWWPVRDSFRTSQFWSGLLPNTCCQSKERTWKFQETFPVNCSASQFDYDSTGRRTHC